jgi:hypothetical protein
LAIKAGMEKWLLDIYDVFTDRLSDSDEKLDGRLNPSFLPGLGYARALAMRTIEDRTNEEVSRIYFFFSNALEIRILGPCEE